MTPTIKGMDWVDISLHLSEKRIYCKVTFQEKNTSVSAWFNNEGLDSLLARLQVAKAALAAYESNVPKLRLDLNDPRKD